MATSSSSSSASAGSSSGPEMPNLTMHDLETITNQFSDENKIGHGGYGEVYRGRYNGSEIAVKKLFIKDGSIDDKAFQNEFSQLKKVRHENIIRLIAYCSETKPKYVVIDEQRILVTVINRALCFEYMPQGSLAKHVSDDSCIHNWATTYKIIRGTCEGLHYLHKGRGGRDHIYHLDLKPDNILLDKDMTPKIADFGLSRLFGSSKTLETNTRFKGTFGFMPREYIDNGLISPKNDVFSLGVIIFYLVAGQNRYSDYCDSRSSSKEIIAKVQEYWKEKLRTPMSYYICKEEDLLAVKTCLELAMRCVAPERANRPSTEGIINELQQLDIRIQLMTEISLRWCSGVERELFLVAADQQPVQMVDEYRNFCEKNVADIVKCSPQLSAPNAHYAVVSIIGEQCSGKSYLLNCLFGTKFPVMDISVGWTQTTRGIMMSRCIGPSSLVLDCEGFYRREGRDTLFERQVALFALTISDVMLVNMSYYDVSRGHGGIELLFKIIFQERVKLEAGLTKILVVLRNNDGESPLQYVRRDVMRNLQKVWRSANAESLRFEDYIEVNVVGLPDMTSQSFQKEVSELRRLLLEVINTDHTRSSKVPASSFAVSSKMLWDTIRKE